MTLVRRKALEISSWVTWLAAPGCKEWAEGLEREVAFIKSDWRALAWALGGIRVVFDRREAPIMSLAEVPQAAKKYFDGRATATTVTKSSGFLLGLAAAYGVFMLVPIHQLQMERLSAGLMMGAMALMGYRLHRYGKVEIRPPSDLHECALYFRATLERDVEFYYGPAAWLCWIASLIAPTLMQRVGGHLLSSLVPLAVMLALMRVPRRKLLRKIDELDALLPRASEDVG